jgi:hypothetical protein
VEDNAESPNRQEMPDKAVEGLGGFVRFPAVGVQLRQPRGFEKDKAFDGFGLREKTASVMVVGIPGPYQEVSAGFSAERMKARGFLLLSKADHKVGATSGMLIQFEQSVGGETFQKWSLVFGNAKKTTLVTATYPKAEAADLSALLKACVLSAKPDDGPAEDPAANLPFELGASKKLQRATAVARALAFTKDGKLPVAAPEDPMFIAASSLGASYQATRETAERRIRQTAGAKDLNIQSTAAITIDGLQGFETLATATEEKSGAPLAIYQVMLFSDDGYLLLQGLVGKELRDEYLSEFKSLARSLKQK